MLEQNNNVSSVSIANAMYEKTKQKLNSIYHILEEHIELPSDCIFYNERTQDCIYIRPMTAKEEDLLSNQKLLKSGKAFDELIKSCVTNWNGIKFEELLIGDKNAILAAIRVISLGNEYNASLTCPSCLTKSDIVFNMSEEFKYKHLGAEPIDGNTNSFEWVSPKGIKIIFKLPNQTDQNISSEEEKKKRQMYKSNYKETPTIDFLKRCIISIEDIVNKNEIEQLLTNMPTSETRSLIKYIREIAPDYNMNYSFECPECNKITELQVPITAEFFWPEGGSTEK